MKKNKSEVLAYLGLVLMTTIIGLSFIFVKIALRHALPVDLLAHRFTVAALGILIYYLIFKKEKPKIHKSHWGQLLLLSLFYPVLLFTMQTIGLQFTSASEAGILSAMAPVFTLVFAAWFLKEKSNVWQMLSVLLSVSGVVYIMYKNGVDQMNAVTLKGDFFILLSVLSMAFYFVLGRKANKTMKAMDITFFMTIAACIFFNLISIALHVKNGSVDAYFSAFQHKEFLWSILYLGILSSFLTSFLTNNALKFIPAAQVSIFNNFSPVITVFAGVIILSETLLAYHIIGGMMVLIGIIGVNVLKKRANDSEIDYKK